MEDNHYENTETFQHPQTRLKVAGARCSRIRVYGSQLWLRFSLPQSEEARGAEEAEEILKRKRQRVLYRSKVSAQRGRRGG